MYRFLDYRVEEVMTSEPVTVTPQTTLAAAEQIFERHGFNGLPVVGEEGELLGFVTKLDLLAAFRFTEEHVFPPYEEIMKQPVSRVMTRDVLTVTPRAPLTRVLQKMLDSRNKSFPVVDGHRLVGVVAREDVLEGLRRAVSEERSGSEPDA
jgi:CBS domain-containing protein